MTATATKDARQKEQQLTEFHELHVDTLAVVGDNIREVGDVSELAASIKTDGMIEPIIATMRATVGEDGQNDLGVRFTVVAGHRRLAAAKLAGLDTVPVILRSMDEEQRVRAMLVENLIRENLTPLEEARAYQRLVDEFDLTQRELSAQVGKSQGHISKRLALLQLPDEVQAQVDSGGIAIADAVELAKLSGHPERIARVLDRTEWQSIESMIESQLGAVEREKNVEAAAAKLEKTGVTVVRTIDDGGYQTKLPKGTHQIVRSAAGYGTDQALIFDPKKHESEPCHAVAINPRDLKVIDVCTNRRNHPKVQTVAQKRNEQYNRTSASHVVKNGAARDKAREEFEAATTARRAFLAEFLGGKAPKAELLTLILNKLIDDAIEDGETEVVELAAVALGIATVNEDGDLDAVDAVDAINQYTAKSEANRLRAALAITLADSESRISIGWGWREAESYFALLEKHGYKPSKFERSKLPKPAKAAS